MKISSLRIGVIVFVLLAISGAIFWQKTQTRDISGKNRDDSSVEGRVATASASDKINLLNPKKKTGVLPAWGKTKKQNQSSKTRVATTNLQQLPFGISNPYSQQDSEIKAKLPAVLKDLGLSDSGDGEAGFVVDEIARKHTEVVCNDIGCQEYDFTLAKDLIDLVVGQGKVNLWIVINSSSSEHKFSDGKEREEEKTYLPDGYISRQAYKDYLEKMVGFVNSYGKQVSGNSNWYVALWNIDNEVPVEYKNAFDGDIESATTAYANLVVDTSEVLRRLSPQSKIVLAGAGEGAGTTAGTGGISQADFYEKLFSKLKQTSLNYSPFDYWEGHWFGKSSNYKESKKGFGAKDFIKFLQDNGYGDKELVIRAGATYSGQNTQERKQLMNDYQSERDQAEFLVKRFVYNVANGVKKIAWSTIYERARYQGERNVHFQYISLIYDGSPDGVSKNQKCVEGWLPCPDPGKGVKKLSYYSYKKLVEVLKGSDWNDIQIIQEKDDVYVYKLNKKGESIWVAWNDSSVEKKITISGITSNGVKVTEIIPKYETGKEVMNYGTAFNTETVSVGGGGAVITLKHIPVFVEEK